MTANISFQFLDDFLVDCWRALGIFGLVLEGFLVGFNHVHKGVFHALLYEIFRLYGDSAHRSLNTLTITNHIRKYTLGVFLILLAALVLIFFKVLDFEVHYYFDTASNIFENLKAVGLWH